MYISILDTAFAYFVLAHLISLHFKNSLLRALKVMKM